MFSSNIHCFKGKNYFFNFNNDAKKHTQDKLIEKNKRYDYGLFLYEKKKIKILFKIQCFSDKFYEIFDINIKFDFVIEDKNINIHDYYIYKYKNKYLLITSENNKNSLYSKIYIITLDKYKIIDFQRPKLYKSVYCITKLAKNSNYIFIILFDEIKEENNKIISNSISNHSK